jgi:hypothetical protein
MRRLIAFVLVLGVCVPMALAQPANETAQAKPISVLAWLVGGVWVADASKLGPGVERIETRYQWSDNNSYVRFTTHFITPKGPMKNYDGNFFWDPAKKSLAMWYMDAKNTITQGSMTFDADRWQMNFSGEDFEGKQADFRVEVARKSNDLYHWTLNQKTADGWKKLIELDYARKTESAG